MKTLAVVAALVLVGAGFVVAIRYFGWSEITGKAWSVTYEVTGPGSAPVALRYTENPDTRKRDAPRTVDATGVVPWTTDVVINSGQKAEVTATPSGNEALTCRILLDGERVWASATAAPGQAVTCTKVTDR
ncbi:MmpS family transport accessory protein [Lentzea sp. NPDC042327]|uniref:MmpS family transport accessory protein n=1 Tax=Lentzea sp. NPDC042327 TaxID=3154801 RepID=UPI0033F2E67E